jgi:hypothetical protein
MAVNWLANPSGVGRLSLPADLWVRGCHLVKHLDQLVSVRQRRVTHDALQNDWQNGGVRAKSLEEGNELLLLMLTGHDAKGGCWDELEINHWITLWIKLHIPERCLVDERDHEVFLEVHQSALVLLND